MPLYLEILDHDRHSSDFAATGVGASILSSWSSESTGETVRLVDTPDVQASPRATPRGMRLVFG